MLRQAALIGPIALLAFALRLYHVAAQGLWADEGFTAEYAALGWRSLVRTIAAIDPHPAGYYLVVKAWLTVVGDTDFTLRYLSVWLAVLTVVALFALVRRIAGTPAGLAAALLLALNPLAIWYAQEARQYAPVAFGATLATLRLRVALERGSRRAWLLYALVMAGTLHLHYFALPLAAFHAYLAWRACLWRPDRLRALAAFVLVGALFLPWWMAAHALDYSGWMERVGLAGALRRTAWAFAVGTAIYPDWGWLLAAPTLAAAGIGCVILLSRRRSWGDALLLVGWAVVPLGAAYLLGVLGNRPAFHERYVSIGAPALMGLAGIGVGRLWVLGLDWIRRARLAGQGFGSAGRASVGAAAVLAAVALVSGAAAADVRVLVWQFTDPHFSKEDLRAVAAFLAPRASPDDAMIGAPGRLNLYRRYAAVRMPSTETDVVWDQPRLERELAAAIAGRRQVWFLGAGSEVDRATEAWLDARGYRIDGRWFGLAPLASWLMAADPPQRDRGAAFGAGGAPTVVAEKVGIALDRTTAGYVVRVVGDWRLSTPTAELKESLRLVDPTGRTVAQVDRTLGGDVDPLTARPPGFTSTVRSGLRVPPDLPAGAYGVRLVVYTPDGSLRATPSAGQGPAEPELALGEVRLDKAPPADPSLVEPPVADGGALGPSLRLIGHGLSETPVQAGSALPVELHWQALAPNAFAASLPLTRVALAGPAAGIPPEARTIEGASPADGGLLRDDRSLIVPRDAAPGRHDVVVRLPEPRAEELVVGAVQVTAAPPRAPVPPPQHALSAGFQGVTLAGYDLDGQPKAGANLRVGLHWRATDGVGRDLTVFVHLVDASGKPLAQHDGAPCAGACPSAGWAPGDELLDEHVLALPAALPPGRYGLVVGLYDPGSGARLPRAAGGEPPDSARLGEVEIGA